MSAKNALLSFGLSARETTIYLTLRKNGALPVAALARLTGIPRVSVYSCLESLQRREVVNLLKKNRSKLYEAQPPAILLELLKERFASFESALPVLNTLRSESSADFSIRLYEGQAQCRRAQSDHYDLLARKKVKLVRSIAHPDLAKAFPRFVPFMIQKRREMGIATRLIVPEVSKKAIPVSYGPASGSGNREMRTLPKNFPFNGNCLIGGGAILFIITERAEPISLFIQSKAAYEILVALFDFAWELLPA